MRSGARVRTLVASYAVASLVLSLGLRLVHRGGYCPGFDVLGAANGLFMASTMTVAEIFAEVRIRPYWQFYSWNVQGLPSLVPGWLAACWPSEYWAYAIAPAIVAVSLFLVARAVDLRGRDAWVIALAWGASAALVSWSLTGFLYVSSILPYALALWITLRWQSHRIATVLLIALALQTCWFVQELGRTVFVVFLAAALLLPRVSWQLRAIWLLAAAWQQRLAVEYPTFNTMRMVHMTVPPLAEVWSRLGVLGGRWLHADIDIPVLPVAAALAIAVMGRRRWFWGALIGGHAGLILLLAVNDGMQQGVDTVWPRRTLLWSFVCVAAVVAAWRERPRARPWLVGLLLVGNVWQLASTVRWSREPLPAAAAEGFTLPYVHTTLDYSVPFLLVDWYREMRARVDAGRKLLVVYNLEAFDENPTNPAGVLERLYLHLGDARFRASVLVFGSTNQRWNELPIRPLRQLDAVLDGIADPQAYDGYRLTHPGDDEQTELAGRFRADVATVMGAIARRFQVQAEPAIEDAAHRRLIRFALAPLPSPP